MYVMLSRKVSRVDLSSAYENGILTKKSSVRKLETDHGPIVTGKSRRPVGGYAV